MPVLDMPLEELRTYMGRNPRPDDFDAYWDSALSELDQVDPQVELSPAAFPAPFAECFHLYFTGIGGARVHAKYLRPKQRNAPSPAVLQFHGYSMNSGDWQHKLQFVAMGYAVAALDVRGQGGLSQDVGGVTGNTLQGHIIRGLEQGPEALFYRGVYLDTVRLAKIVMGFDEVDASRVGATGWSQGGGLTLACAALVPEIRKAAPAYPFLCDYQRAWEMDMAERAYHELKQFFKRFDPTHERADEWWRRLGYIDAQHLAPRIKAQVLMGTGLLDDICPPSTQFAAYNRIAAKKQMALYPDFGHEDLPGFHDKVFTFLSDL